MNDIEKKKEKKYYLFNGCSKRVPLVRFIMINTYVVQTIKNVIWVRIQKRGKRGNVPFPSCFRHKKFFKVRQRPATTLYFPRLVLETRHFQCSSVFCSIFLHDSYERLYYVFLRKKRVPCFMFVDFSAFPLIFS